MRRRQAGFTLTELMIVVTIIGVLVTMATGYLRARVRPIDVANRFGDLVREASRRAVALGPVRVGVVKALGSRARTRITAAPSVPPAPPGTVTFMLERLQETGPDSADWVPIETYTTDVHVLPDSWAPGVGSYEALAPTTDWTKFSAECRPDGICDARTLFFQAASAGPVNEQLARISIMPLGGAITTRTDWN